MTITDEQLREICARRKSRHVKPGVCAGDIHDALYFAHPDVRASLVRISYRVGRFLFDCFEGAGKTVRLFGVSAGGVL